MSVFKIINPDVGMVNDESKVMKLYRVRLWIEGRYEERMVLSYDTESAIGMARCATGCAIYQKVNENQIRAIAEVVGLTIQGWGKQQF